MSLFMRIIELAKARKREPGVQTEKHGGAYPSVCCWLLWWRMFNPLT